MTTRDAYKLKVDLHTARFQRESFVNNYEDAQRNTRGLGTPGSVIDHPTYIALTADIDAAEAKLAAAEAEVGGRVYRVPTENLSALEEKIAKINKRVVKTGTAPVVLTVTNETDEQVRKSKNTGEVIEVIRWTFVIISGEPARIGGYEFVAAIQHTEAGNIIAAIPQIRQDVRGIKTGDLTRYINVDPNCDHCGLDRRRKDTYIVQHRENGNLIQVGRNCLGDFTGIHNPDQAAKYAEYLIDLMDSMDAAEREPGAGGGTPVISLEEYVTHVVTCIRESGWISGGAAYEYGGTSTKQAALGNLRDCEKARYAEPGPKDNHVLPTVEDREEAAAVIAWARETYTEKVVESAIEAGNTDEAQFLNNMRVGFARDYADQKVLGFVAYGPQARRKATEKVLREEKVAKASEGKGYLGEVGQKGFEVEATLVRVIEFEDRYSYNGGTKPMYIFTTADGNDVKWSASDWADAVLAPKLTCEDATERGIEFHGVNKKGEVFRRMGQKSIGTTYKLRGTIKAHDDGKGKYGDKNYGPSTVLTRCKVTETI